MGLGTLTAGLNGAGGGSSVSVPLSVDSVGATSITVRRGTPASGTLQTWDLEYREVGAPSWTEWATGLTGETEKVTGRSPQTQYEFRATGYVLLETTAQASAETEELVGPPLTMWTAITGGLDLGSALTGGGVWFWNNPVPGTFQATIKNLDAEPVDAFQTVLSGVEATNAPEIGRAMRYGATWTTDATEVPVGSGTNNSPSAGVSPVVVLPAPIASGATAIYQAALNVGRFASGKTFGNIWPESNQVNSVYFAEGNSLGTTINQNSGVGPPQPYMFLRRVSGMTFLTFYVFGDSTIASVRPLSATNSGAKEGPWHFANNALRTNGKRVRVYSCGQGAFQWSQTLARVRSALPWLVGKASVIAVQVWTWNSPWSTLEQAATVWSEYLALEAEVIEAGFGCVPLLLNPYTDRTATGQPEAFAAIKANVLAHPRGIALDEIMGDTSWPNLPASESEDNVHNNRTGAFRAGPLIAAELLNCAATYYPELV